MLFMHLEGRPAEYETVGDEQVLKRKELEPNPTIVIFLAKTRLRYRENARNELGINEQGLVAILKRNKSTGFAEATRNDLCVYRKPHPY